MKAQHTRASEMLLQQVVLGGIYSSSVPAFREEMSDRFHTKKKGNQTQSKQQK